MVFSLAAPGIYGAKSLIDILGPGNLETSAAYRVFNERFKLIGEVEQRYSAETKEERTLLFMLYLKRVSKTLLNAVNR